MTAKEKLDDLVALRGALKSERDALARLSARGAYRSRRLRNVIVRIRSLRLALLQATKELLTIRGSTNGSLAARIATQDARIAEIDVAITHANQAARIERLLKIQAQMEALAALGLTPDMLERLGDPDGASRLEAILARPAVAGGHEDDSDVDEDVILS